MNKNWDKWEQEAVDHMDCMYDAIRLTQTEKFERASWLAWSAGRDALDFVNEFMKDTRPEW